VGVDDILLDGDRVKLLVGKRDGIDDELSDGDIVKLCVGTKDGTDVPIKLRVGTKDGLADGDDTGVEVVAVGDGDVVGDNIVPYTSTSAKHKYLFSTTIRRYEPGIFPIVKWIIAPAVSLYVRDDTTCMLLSNTSTSNWLSNAIQVVPQSIRWYIFTSLIDEISCKSTIHQLFPASV